MSTDAETTRANIRQNRDSFDGEPAVDVMTEMVQLVDEYLSVGLDRIEPVIRETVVGVKDEFERAQLGQEIHDLEFLVEVLLEIGGSGGGNLDDSRLSSPAAIEVDTDSDTRGVAAQTAV